MTLLTAREANRERVGSASRTDSCPFPDRTPRPGEAIRGQSSAFEDGTEGALGASMTRSSGLALAVVTALVGVLSGGCAAYVPPPTTVVASDGTSYSGAYDDGPAWQTAWQNAAIASAVKDLPCVATSVGVNNLDTLTWGHYGQPIVGSDPRRLRCAVTYQLVPDPIGMLSGQTVGANRTVLVARVGLDAQAFDADAVTIPPHTIARPLPDAIRALKVRAVPRLVGSDLQPVSSPVSPELAKQCDATARAFAKSFGWNVVDAGADVDAFIPCVGGLDANGQPGHDVATLQSDQAVELKWPVPSIPSLELRANGKTIETVPVGPLHLLCELPRSATRVETCESSWGEWDMARIARSLTSSPTLDAFVNKRDAGR